MTSGERGIEMDKQQRLKNSIKELKANGIRITPQRHSILEYLIGTTSHPTADEIYRELESNFPNMSVATVYNNLRVLKETGLIKELTYGDAASRFDFTVEAHYHAICEKCGKMVDFDYSGLQEIERIAEEKLGFKINHHRMELYGECPECIK